MLQYKPCNPGIGCKIGQHEAFLSACLQISHLNDIGVREQQRNVWGQCLVKARTWKRREKYSVIQSRVYIPCIVSQSSQNLLAPAILPLLNVLWSLFPFSFKAIIAKHPRSPPPPFIILTFVIRLCRVNYSNLYCWWLFYLHWLSSRIWMLLTSILSPSLSWHL